MPFMISIYLLPDCRFRNRATRLVKLTLRGVIPWKLNAIMRHSVETQRHYASSRVNSTSFPEK